MVSEVTIQPIVLFVYKRLFLFCAESFFPFLFLTLEYKKTYAMVKSHSKIKATNNIYFVGNTSSQTTTAINTALKSICKTSMTPAKIFHFLLLVFLSVLINLSSSNCLFCNKYSFDLPCICIPELTQSCRNEINNQTRS